MNFTIKRCIDNLGRIVLPKDLRTHYEINAGDMIEIIATENGILLKILDKQKRGD